MPKEEATPPPKPVSVTVTKPSQDARVGVGIKEKFGVPVINSIREDGLVANTDLKIGMQIYSINGAHCSGKESALAMLRVTEGTIKIDAGPLGLVTVSAIKPTMETKVGIHLTRHKGSSDIIIDAISQTGLMAASDLKEGMILLKINDKDVTGMTLKDVLALIHETEGTIKVEAYENLALTALKQHRPPPGLNAGGEWGTTTYIGPMTGAFAFAAIPTIIGWAIILLFCPMDKLDVYKINGNLYTPNGDFFKTASSKNFFQQKKEHCTKPPKPGGRWGTTTYIGPMTCALAIVSVITVIGWFLVLLFCPLDERDVYRRNGNLYYVNGDFCKTATDKNFMIRESRHV